MRRVSGLQGDWESRRIQGPGGAGRARYALALPACVAAADRAGVRVEPQLGPPRAARAEEPAAAAAVVLAGPRRETLRAGGMGRLAGAVPGRRGRAARDAGCAAAAVRLGADLFSNSVEGSHNAARVAALEVLVGDPGRGGQPAAARVPAEQLRLPDRDAPRARLRLTATAEAEASLGALPAQRHSLYRVARAAPDAWAGREGPSDLQREH